MCLVSSQTKYSGICQTKNCVWVSKAIDACSWTCVNMGENGRFLAPIELELTRRQNEHQILAWMGTLTMACGIFPWKLFLCENNSLVGSICRPQQSSCHPLSLGSWTQARLFSVHLKGFFTWLCGIVLNEDTDNCVNFKALT